MTSRKGLSQNFFWDRFMWAIRLVFNIDILLLNF
jgi:hypothetical protein